MRKIVKKTKAAELKSRQLADARRERKNDKRRKQRETSRREKKRVAKTARKSQSARQNDAPLEAPPAAQTITQIDAGIAQYLTSQVALEAQAAAERAGLKLEVLPAVVDREYGDAMKVTLVLRVPQFDARGKEVPYTETAWLRYAHTLGLPTEWLGRRVTIGRVVYRISGLDLRHPTKQVLLSHDNKQFRETAENIVKYVRG